MRIAHVSDCYLPRLGGIEMQIHDLATRQRMSGLDVEVLTPTRTSAGDLGLAEPDPDWVHRISQQSAHQTTRALAAAVSARQLVTAQRYDVVHVHASVFSPFATAAAYAATRAGVPTVVTIHSLWAGLGPLPRMADVAMRLRTWPVVWSTVSEKAAAPLRLMLGEGRPVVVLPNGIDAQTWRIDLRPRDTRTVTVVSVMRLASRKRPLALLQMMRHVRALVSPDIAIRLVLVGDGPLRPALARYLHRYDMADWVTIPGQLERPEIRSIFASADVYVAPAELESFGIAALEARSAGLPVVASSRGGVDEFITHGHEGLLAGDDAEMVEALVAMIADATLRGAITRHNHDVAPRVSWPMVLERAARLYDQASGLVSPPRLDEAARATWAAA
jgi:glycosyltransferase involved in cell wall biosynthesis